MKILLATETRGWSGGAAQTLALARGLAARGHAVRIACRSGSEIGRRAAAERLETATLRFRGDADVASALALHRLVRADGIEVLHAQHPRAHGVCLLATLCAPAAPRLVVTRRVSFPVGTNPFSRWKYSSRRIDALVAVSGGIREALIAGGARAERIHVIYSGVDPATFRPSPPAVLDALRETLALAPDTPCIIKVANFADWKGQDTFLRAAALLVRAGLQARFVLAGRDTDGPACRALIEALALTDHVRPLGFRTDVADLLALAQLSVNAARGGEGLSGALRESLALAVPVVATDVSGNRELVMPGRTGWLVPPDDPAALATAIREALEKPAEAARLAEQGRARVLAELTVDRMVERTESLYRRVLAADQHEPAP